MKLGTCQNVRGRLSYYQEFLVLPGHIGCGKPDTAGSGAYQEIHLVFEDILFGNLYPDFGLRFGVFDRGHNFSAQDASLCVNFIYSQLNRLPSTLAISTQFS